MLSRLVILLLTLYAMASTDAWAANMPLGAKWRPAIVIPVPAAEVAAMGGSAEGIIVARCSGRCGAGRGAASLEFWRDNKRIAVERVQLQVIASASTLDTLYLVTVDSGTRPRLLAVRYGDGHMVISELPRLPAIASPTLGIDGKDLVAAGANRRGVTTAVRLKAGRKAWSSVGPALADIGKPVVGVGKHLERSALYIFDAAEATKGYRLDSTRGTWVRLSPAPMPIVRTVTALPWTIVALGEERVAFLNTVTGRWQARTLPKGATGIAILPAAKGLPAVAVADQRGVQILHATVPTDERALHAVDLVVVAAYPLSLIAIGIVFARRTRTGNDYFRGGQRLPGWAAGFSLLGAKISAISFISVPGTSFVGNWTRFPFQVAQIFIVPLATRYIIPLMYRLNITSVYEYLEMRFDVVIRTVCAVLYVLQSLSMVGLYIFLPALIVSTTMNVDLFASIIVIGLVATFYASLGGLEAIAWVEVGEVVTIFLGAVISLVFATAATPASPTSVLGSWVAQGKTTLFLPSMSLTDISVLVLLLYLPAQAAQYMSSQGIVMRYMSTPNLAAARRSAWTSLLIGLPVIGIFYALGTVFFSYYQANPAALPLGLGEQDELFPWFIALELPTGLVGLLIGAIFGSAMSTFSGTIHSVSTVVTTDLYARFRPGLDGRSIARAGRITTASLGILGTGMALIVATLPAQALFDRMYEIISFIIGLVSGLFVLGMLVPRAHSRGVLIGVALALVGQVLFKTYTDLQYFVFSFTGLVMTVGLGWLASVILPPKEQRDLTGLTFATARREPDESTRAPKQ